jgi:hypothetical protein
MKYVSRHGWTLLKNMFTPFKIMIKIAILSWITTLKYISNYNRMLDTFSYICLQFLFLS